MIIFKTLLLLKIFLQLPDFNGQKIAFDRPVTNYPSVVVATHYVGRTRKQGVYRFIFHTYVFDENEPNLVLLKMFSLSRDEAFKRHQDAIQWAIDFYDEENVIKNPLEMHGFQEEEEEIGLAL